MWTGLILLCVATLGISSLALFGNLMVSKRRIALDKLSWIRLNRSRFFALD